MTFADFTLVSVGLDSSIRRRILIKSIQSNNGFISRWRRNFFFLRFFVFFVHSPTYIFKRKSYVVWKHLLQNRNQIIPSEFNAINYIENDVSNDAKS